MLRITVHNYPGAVTLRLEGRLAAPWLRAVEECWQTTRAHRRKRVISVDLTGVTFIDAAGKACLAGMQRHGANFVAADCLTKSIVDELTQVPVPDQASPRRRK